MNLLALAENNEQLSDVSAISDLISRRLAEATVDAPQPLRQISAEHLATRGKQLRGRLALNSALGLGVDFDTALHWAAAVELLHNASLVHDDICDGDAERRGKKTVNKQHGAAIAVCLGDYYIVTAFCLALQAAPQTIPVFARSVTDSIGGQAGEFVGSGYPSWSQYRAIAVRKTAPLLSLPVIGAAVIARQSIDEKSVERYFLHTALCFQIINDLDNVLDALGALTPCSDLSKCRPNAVIACFRDALPAPQRAEFDCWNDQVRCGAVRNTTALAQPWWQQLQHAEALARTAQHLEFHFKAAGSELLRLAPHVQNMLNEFHHWLEREIGNVKTGERGAMGAGL